MKIYLLLIACTLGIATHTISDKAKAHNQFNELNISSDQELNVNYREIIKTFSQELRVDKTNKKALLTRAYAKGKINNFKSALKDLNNLIKMDSDFNDSAIFLRGWIHKNLKNYSDAMDDYSRSIKNNVFLKTSYANRGFIKDILGDQKGACSDWEKGGALGNEQAISAFKYHCS